MEGFRPLRVEQLVLEQAKRRPAHLTQTVMDAYRAPFPTPASRLAMLCWPRDIPVREGDPSYSEC